MKDALSQLRSITVEIGGKQGELVLRVPPADFELPLLANAPLSDAARLEYLRLIFAGFIESFDGAPLTKERALGFAANPSSAAALLRLRAELYDDVRLQGLVHLACPHCAHEATLELMVLVIALGAKPWPVAAPDGMPTEPSLSSLFAVPKRPPGIATAARARLELPSARLGSQRPFSEAVLGAPVTQTRDSDAWNRWVLADRPFDPARAHCSFGNAGFRAILRMTVALDSLDGARDLAPDIVERLPMSDFAFVDAVYHLLHHGDVEDAETASIACAGCAQRFLIVL